MRQRQCATFDTSMPRMLFDGNLAQCFMVKLGNHARNTAMRNISTGVLYIFIIHQDQTGNRFFKWPEQVANPSWVDPAPSSVSVQAFIGLNGQLQALMPGTWNEVQP